jgi:hypothetical protein
MASGGLDKMRQFTPQVAADNEIINPFLQGIWIPTQLHIQTVAIYEEEPPPLTDGIYYAYSGSPLPPKEIEAQLRKSIFDVYKTQFTPQDSTEKLSAIYAEFPVNLEQVSASSRTFLAEMMVNTITSHPKTGPMIWGQGLRDHTKTFTTIFELVGFRTAMEAFTNLIHCLVGRGDGKNLPTDAGLMVAFRRELDSRFKRFISEPLTSDSSGLRVFSSLTWNFMPNKCLRVTGSVVHSNREISMIYDMQAEAFQNNINWECF